MSFEEQIELRRTDNVRGKISELLFAPDGGYCVNYSSSNISNTRNSVSWGYPNNEKTVENTTRSGVFLTKFQVFG